MRTSAPSDFSWSRSAREPGTRSMSPNEQNVTPGRDAIACARSSVSSAVTQTGQPGPCTSSMAWGSTSSMPYLTIVCVWPPHTSMIVQGRVTLRSMAYTSFRTARASRNSSRYFIEFPQLLHRVQKLEHAARLGLVDLGEGKADMHEHVIAGDDVGDVVEADALRDAAEVNLAHQDPMLAERLDHATRNAEAHVSSPLSSPPQPRQAGRDSGRHRRAGRYGDDTPQTPRKPAAAP